MRRLLTLDIAVVIAFVVLGRETHDEGRAIADIATTAAPFLIALVTGWLATRADRAPVDVLRGALVAVITVAGGMLLRSIVFDDGTAMPFVIVATVFNLAGMVGWRLIARRRISRRSTVSV